MTIQLYLSDTIIVLAVFTALFLVLYVRKNVELTNKNRLAPFREPLVPEDFWRVCKQSDSPTIVWIVRHYLPDFKAGAEAMAHDINKYLVEHLGWTITVIVPYSSVQAYEGVKILQFYQKSEIEVAISKAHCILSQYQVIETAAITAHRSKKPLVLFAHDDSLGLWIVKAKSIHNNVNIVNNSEWIATINQQYGLNSIILNPPVDWRRYVTYTERRYITLVNMNGNKGAEQFFKIAAALPEYEFLGIAGSYAQQYTSPLSSNVTLWKSQSDMRTVYNVTGILCVLSKSESWGRVAIEACASGIPVIASPTPGLKEALGVSGIFADRDDIDSWVRIIHRLKSDPLYYKKYSELTLKRAYELDPKPQLDKFKVWIEEL